MRPEISVVCPIYNQAHLVSNMIQSMIDQTLQEWELVLVDDGSSDNLTEVIVKFNDPRIRLLALNHVGMVAARNYGNSMARADIIAIHDADDLSMPDRLEKSLRAIKDADVVYHGIYVNMWETKLNCILRRYVSAKPFSIEELLKSQYIPGVCVIRKKVWEEKPFRLETQGCFDYMMHLDWALSGFKYKALDEGLYEYVRHQNSASITAEKIGKRKESLMKIREIVLKEYAQSVDPNFE